MAFSIDTLKPRPAIMEARKGTKTKRDLGPNIWLDPKWPFNLKTSYDQAKPFELDLPGKVENTVYTKGAKKGQPTTKLTGEAADAITLIREAAEKLQIGVAVQTRPAKRAGYITVAYQGQKRKAPPKPKTTATGTTPPVTPEGSNKPAEDTTKA